MIVGGSIYFFNSDILNFYDNNKRVLVISSTLFNIDVVNNQRHSLASVGYPTSSIETVFNTRLTTKNPQYASSLYPRNFLPQIHLFEAHI